MALPPVPAQGIGDSAAPSPGNTVSFEIKHHIARLPLENKGVCAPGFGCQAPLTALESALVAAISDVSAAERQRRRRVGVVTMGPSRPVLMLVENEKRAADVLKVLSSDEDMRVSTVRPQRERPNSIFEPRDEDAAPAPAGRIFNAKAKTNDVLIVQDWHALELFRDGQVSMPGICMLSSTRHNVLVQ